MAAEQNWLKVSGTMLPGLPLGSRLIVEDISAEQFEVVFQPGKSASLFSVFTTNPPQRIRLTRHQVAVFEDIKTQVNRNRELILKSFFEVKTEQYGDDSISRLVLNNGDDEFTLVREPMLLDSDLEWLKSRFNEWLGWEFPSHCVNCGQPLQACDLEWPRRRIDCSACDFEGPAPDPFETEVPPPPPVSPCPSCGGEIWLRDVNRNTGGCRCHRCGWVSEEVPAIWRDGQILVGEVVRTALEFGLGGSFQNTEYLVSEELVRAEYPRAKDALTLLEQEGLVTYSDDKTPIVVINRWRITSVKNTGIVLAILTLIATWLLISAWSVAAEHRTWGQYLALACCQTSWLVVAPSLGLLAWWANQRVHLTFTPQALLWRVGKKKRLINWKTLTAVAASQGGWLPMIFLKHGGAGIGLAMPTHSVARAITRLCQINQADATA